MLKMKNLTSVAFIALALAACQNEDLTSTSTSESPTVTRVTAVSSSKVVLEGSGLSQVSRAGIVGNTAEFGISNQTSNSITLTPTSPVVLIAGTVYRFFVQDAAGQTSTAEITLTVDAAQITGVLPISKGGTGSGNAAGARTALGMGTLATGNFSGSGTQVLYGDGTWAAPQSGISQCATGMTLIPGSATASPFCIDTDTSTSVAVPYATAVIICSSGGKHLCEREELKKACDSGRLTSSPLTSTVHWSAETYTVITTSSTAPGQTISAYALKTINGGCGGTDQDSLGKHFNSNGQVDQENTHLFRCCSR